MIPLAADDKRGILSVPWACITFFVLYLVVLFTFQLNERNKEIELTQWYVESGLYDLEYTNYISYLRFNARTQLSDQLEAAHGAGDKLTVIRAMAFDPGFENENRELGRQYWTPLQQQKWKKERELIEGKASEIPRYRFGLVPSAPRPSTYLSWHFLHDSFTQWLTTVLVALLFIWPMEAKLGAARTSIMFILGGIVVGMVYVALMNNSYVPMIGSTPIAALIIGAFISLFGLQKIDFLYFHPKQKACKTHPLPAIILLPLFAALPIYEYFGGSNAPHVWAAQVAGLIAGAVLVQLAQRQDVQGAEEEQVEQTDEHNLLRQNLQSGWSSMAAMDFLNAKNGFEKTLAIEPDRFDALSGLYHIAKLKPQEEEFHKSAEKALIIQEADNPDTIKQQYFLYKDYVRRADNNALLSADVKILTVIRMVAVDQMREAEQLAERIEEEYSKHKWLSWMYRVLADAHDNYGNKGKANKYRGLSAAHDDNAPQTETSVVED